MSKKLIAVITLILTVCFLLLGVIFTKAAGNNEGINVYSSELADGKPTQTLTGNIGRDSKKKEMFKNGGMVFYALAGVNGNDVSA